MRLCKNVSMRTSLDFPDPLFRHLKARAALEGRTLRDLVVELLEKGLNAQDAVDPRQRLQARPLFGGQTPAGAEVPLDRLSHADLQALLNEDDDERARVPMAGR